MPCTSDYSAYRPSEYRGEIDDATASACEALRVLTRLGYDMDTLSKETLRWWDRHNKWDDSQGR